MHIWEGKWYGGDASERGEKTQRRFTTKSEIVEFLFYLKQQQKRGEKTETFTRHVEFMILPNEILNVIWKYFEHKIFLENYIHFPFLPVLTLVQRVCLFSAAWNFRDRDDKREPQQPFTIWYLYLVDRWIVWEYIVRVPRWQKERAFFDWNV